MRKIHEIRVKVDQNGYRGPHGCPPVEKKVTEEGSRVGIIVQVLGNQGTARSTHRIWAAEGWSSALVWVSAEADGSSCEATVRERPP